MTDWATKRRHRRVPFAFNVDFRGHAGDPGACQRIAAVGLHAYTPHVMPSGDNTLLSFTLPDEILARVVTGGRVLQSQSEDPATGKLGGMKVMFVDLDAHDADAGTRRARARKRLAELWRRETPPAVSVQVLQEFYNTLLRKNVSPQAAARAVSLYLRWDVIPNDAKVLMSGIRLQRKWQLSAWDAWILAAAKRADARVLWSEDLNPGRNYDGISVVNPLLE